MIRSAVNGLIGAAGVLVVALCIYLCVQCRQFVEGDYSANTRFAQAVLDDVIRDVSGLSPNGTDPSDVAHAMYYRVSLYTGLGFLLIGIAWAREYGYWSVYS